MNIFEAAYEGMRRAAEEHNRKHGVIGWIEEEDGHPEITCDDFDDCVGCPNNVDGKCTF